MTLASRISKLEADAPTPDVCQLCGGEGMRLPALPGEAGDAGCPRCGRREPGDPPRGNEQRREEP